MKKLFAIALALMLCISVLSVSAFAAFDNVTSLAIVGEGIPGVASWDPADAAGDMTEVSDGVYEKTLELPAGTTMTFKIAGNDTWDDTCNFGSATIVLNEVADLACGGDSGNMTLSASEAMTVKITVNLTGETATILVEGDGETLPPPAPTGDFYVAGEGDLFGNWAVADENQKMTKGDDGIYTKTYENVPAGKYSIKVTQGDWNKESWGGNGENGNLDFETHEAGELVVKFNPNTHEIILTLNDNRIEIPDTGDVSLAAVSVALLAATAGLVVVVSKKKEIA